MDDFHSSCFYKRYIYLWSTSSLAYRWQRRTTYMVCSPISAVVANLWLAFEYLSFFFSVHNQLYLGFNYYYHCSSYSAKFSEKKNFQGTFTRTITASSTLVDVTIDSRHCGCSSSNYIISIRMHEIGSRLMALSYRLFYFVHPVNNDICGVCITITDVQRRIHTVDETSLATIDSIECGSEDVSYTNVFTWKNSSLDCLCICVKAKDQSHVPYNMNKLIFLLSKILIM